MESQILDYLLKETILEFIKNYFSKKIIKN